MHPILLEGTIGDIEIVVRAYGTFLVLAGIVAVSMGIRRIGALGVSRRAAAGALLAAILAGLIGARLLAVAMDPADFAADPGRLLAPAPRDFALHGGIAAASVIMIAWARRAKIGTGSLADALVAPVAVGVAVARIGCFLTGCCAGVESDVPWAVAFPAAALPAGDGGGPFAVLFSHADAVHPTQVYELVAVLACGLLAEVVRRRDATPGTAAVMFAAAFLAVRAANQVLRPAEDGALLGSTALAALYAVTAAVAAVVLVTWLRATRGAARRAAA